MVVSLWEEIIEQEYLIHFHFPFYTFIQNLKEGVEVNMLN